MIRKMYFSFKVFVTLFLSTFAILFVNSELLERNTSYEDVLNENSVLRKAGEYISRTIDDKIADILNQLTDINTDISNLTESINDDMKSINDDMTDLINQQDRLSENLAKQEAALTEAGRDIVDLRLITSKNADDILEMDKGLTYQKTLIDGNTNGILTLSSTASDLFSQQDRLSDNLAKQEQTLTEAEKDIVDLRINTSKITEDISDMDNGNIEQYSNISQNLNRWQHKIN